jgi:hypothetical protein
LSGAAAGRSWIRALVEKALKTVRKQSGASSSAFLKQACLKQACLKQACLKRAGLKQVTHNNDAI